MARFIFAQLVLHVLKKDRWMKDWYCKVKARRGSKIARVAVMRRLTVLIWNMLKHQEPYQCGGPEAARHRKAPATTTTPPTTSEPSPALSP